MLSFFLEKICQEEGREFARLLQSPMPLQIFLVSYTVYSFCFILLFSCFALHRPIVYIGEIFAASVFGELWKLEPLALRKKMKWQREMEWLLCVSDSIVELIPSLQEFPGGGTFEVMVTRPRSDLYVNLPALKKLDTMLVSILEGFRDAEFCYVDRGLIVAGGDDTKTFPSCSSSSRPLIGPEEKWWLPFPMVPQNGLSENMRKRLQQARECTSQILKAATAINSNVLAEMEIPNAYLVSLPKV